MKVHRVVQMVGLTNESGRLASDMYDLNNKIYRSKSTNKEIPISHMDFQHAMRTLVKFIEEEEKTMIGANDIVLSNDEALKAKDHIINGLRSQVETLNGIIEEKDETIQKMLDKPTWTEQPTNGHRYVFSEIPNNEYGKKLARGIKMFLNNDSYTMRVRGQHIKPELKGTGKTSYGQSIEDSTHLRIYIDKKKGE